MWRDAPLQRAVFQTGFFPDEIRRVLLDLRAGHCESRSQRRRGRDPRARFNRDERPGTVRNLCGRPRAKDKRTAALCCSGRSGVTRPASPARSGMLFFIAKLWHPEDTDTSCKTISEAVSGRWAKADTSASENEL